MDKMTRHDAIMAILGVPETHLSTVYKAGIIELLFENIVTGSRGINVMYTSEKCKGTDNLEMYERPRNSHINNSSSCG